MTGVAGSAAADQDLRFLRVSASVHQDIFKWRKNGNGKLTGCERDEFLKDKTKEGGRCRCGAPESDWNVESKTLLDLGNKEANDMFEFAFMMMQKYGVTASQLK